MPPVSPVSGMTCEPAWTVIRRCLGKAGRCRRASTTARSATSRMAWRSRLRKRVTGAELELDATFRAARGLRGAAGAQRRRWFSLERRGWDAADAGERPDELGSAVGRAARGGVIVPEGPSRRRSPAASVGWRATPSATSRATSASARRRESASLSGSVPSANALTVTRRLVSRLSSAAIEASADAESRVVMTVPDSNRTTPALKGRVVRAWRLRSSTP